MSNLGEKLSEEEVRRSVKWLGWRIGRVQTELFVGGGDDEVGRQGRGWNGWHTGVQHHDAGGGQAALHQLVHCLIGGWAAGIGGRDSGYCLV